MRLALLQSILGGLAFLSAGVTPDQDGLMSDPDSSLEDDTPAAGGRANAYQQTNLVSDPMSGITAEHTDANLVNSWGIAMAPYRRAWVADNGTGVATMYNGEGQRSSRVVTIPSPAGGDTKSAPTGVVFNGSSRFVVSNDTDSGPSRFIFATEDGTIAGWSPDVDDTHAFLAVDNSANHAIYKGIALAGNGNDLFLYATDFHNGRVDVFDKEFGQMPPGGFTDPDIPDGYAPFGIQYLNGNLYVTYALQDADKEDDVPGQGHGFIDIFDPDGNLIKRFASRGALNSPWGLAISPANFGKFSDSLLVGNFGDGRINAYDLRTHRRLGRLKDANGDPIEIEGLWGLAFGNGVEKQNTNTLFFAAGPGDEMHGLYGRIDPESRTGHDD